MVHRPSLSEGATRALRAAGRLGEPVEGATAANVVATYDTLERSARESGLGVWADRPRAPVRKDD